MALPFKDRSEFNSHEEWVKYNDQRVLPAFVAEDTEGSADTSFAAALREIDNMAASGRSETFINSHMSTYWPKFYADWDGGDEYFDAADYIRRKVQEEEDEFQADEARDAYDEQEKQRADLEAKENDWRVRLHLGDPSKAKYLYNATDPGILAPLKETNGIIFPYTPTIAVQYNADYANYDLIHSNYRGYFYKGSQVQNILLTATFTANDIVEANYLLASLHFLRTCTKMFYGNDVQRGAPPPVVFLTGLGEYQFNNHPCVITMMNYNLPNDVDYIAAGKSEGFKAPAGPIQNDNGTISRLSATNVGVGGKASRKKDTQKNTKSGTGTDTYKKATYVPTKIDINFTMIPIQTRKQISKDFSLKDYASGALLKKGIW